MEGRVEPGTHCLYMRENLRNRASKCVRKRTQSHVVRRQYTRIVSGRTRNRLICEFKQLKRLCNQSRTAKIPVNFYPLGAVLP